MIPILIPTSHRRLSDPRLQRVIDSIQSQSIETNPIVFGTYGSAINEQKNVNAEIHCRQQMVYYVRGLPPDVEYIGMQDSDIVHLYNDNFEVMLKKMQDNPFIGGLELYRGKVPLDIPTNCIHVNCASAIIRRSLFERIMFSAPNGRCVCFSVKNSIALQGSTFEYLDFVGRVKELV
jgi:hypothetical protein